jgi:hypothetical protein
MISVLLDFAKEGLSIFPGMLPFLAFTLVYFPTFTVQYPPLFSAYSRTCFLIYWTHHNQRTCPTNNPILTHLPNHSYAGPFIWVSLRPFLPGSKDTLEAERVLSKRMLDNGIWLATGEAFKSETPGWYRITFAMSEEDVRFGLGR